MKIIILIMNCIFAQLAFAGDYSLKELKRYANYIAGVSQYGPKLKPTEEDNAIVEEFKQLVQTYPGIRAAYDKIDKTNAEKQRAFVKEKLGLDRVELPPVSKAFNFENFYWSHFYKENQEQKSSKVRFKGGNEIKSIEKRTPAPPSRQNAGEHPCFQNKDVNIPQPKYCDDCLNALNKTLLIYDTEDWENKREALRSNIKLELETGKKFIVWEGCAEYLYLIERKEFKKQ